MKAAKVQEKEDSQVEALQAVAKSFASQFKSAEELAQVFVREAIIRGIYRPGDRLPQDVIANLLGISRIPVRAGFRLLEAEGLLTIYSHRGARVTILNAKEIEELYELRTVLECHLLELAIPRLTPEYTSELRAMAEQLNASATMGSAEPRMAFYDRLYALAERPRIRSLVARLHAEVGQYLLMKQVTEEPPGHFGLLNYIEEGDVAGAQLWLTDHLAAVSAELQLLVSELHGE
ncbi:MAG: transcriptional regulator, GntR family [Acidimicrobiaceae bacterium]|nr:transcriptional regulator, GntR family [Acidimicrobiaceae bacterium]